jgi:hypothetical protein
MVLASREKVEPWRRSFSVYPLQLLGEGRRTENATLYIAERDKPIFGGPYWFLGRGYWQLTLLGRCDDAVKLVILDEQDAVIGDLSLTPDNLTGDFCVHRDITRFEVRAFASVGTTLEVEKLSFVLVEPSHS